MRHERDIRRKRISLESYKDYNPRREIKIKELYGQEIFNSRKALEIWNGYLKLKLREKEITEKRQYDENYAIQSLKMILFNCSFETLYLNLERIDTLLQKIPKQKRESLKIEP
jgi:hypothetical protein